MNAPALVRPSTCGHGLVIAGAVAVSALAACIVVERPELFNLGGVASPRGFALLLAGLALGAVFLRAPDVALCSVVAFVALNLSDVLVRGHGLPSLLQVSFVPLALAGWWNAPPGSRMPPRAVTLLLSAYLIVALCSTVIASDRPAADARLLEHLRGFALFVVVVMLARSASSMRRAVWTFVGCVSLLGSLALVQVVTGDFSSDFGGLARIKYAHVHGTTFEPRIAGPLGDPNFFAQILVLAVPLALHLAWTARGTRQRAGAFAAAGVAGIATVFTYSRGGALALAVVLVGCVVARGINIRKAMLGLIPLAVLLWAAMPEDAASRLTTLGQLLPGSDEVLRPDSSFGERKLFAAAAWRMFADAPLLGVGIGNYGANFVDYAQRVGSDARLYVTPAEGYYPHNLYLELAAETGLAGLVLFGGALLACISQLRQARARLLAAADRSSSAMATGCAIALVGYLLSSLFLHGHFIRYLWLFIGLAAALHRLEPAVDDAARAPAPSLSPQPPAAPVRRVGTPQGRDDAPSATPAIRPAIAVIVSRFPLITETFILREIIEMERQGQPVLLVPLMRERAAVVHREAEPWISRALYTPFVSSSIASANVRMLTRRPRRYLRALWRLSESATSPNFFVRSLALFPKAVYLAERFERDRIRHVHAHYATHPTTVALIVSELTEVTFSFTVHAHDIFVRRTLLRRKLEAAAFVRSISRFNRDFLARYYPEALTRKIQVIHVGIDPDAYGTDAPGRPAPAAAPQILCVASLQRYKGIPVLLDACRLLRDRGVALTCTILGEGPMRPALERQIRDLGLDQAVTLAGARPQHEVADSMRAASLFVLPSVIAPDGQMEGIPVALMEAMASRLPVVASALSGIPEAVHHGTTGVLVHAGAASELALAIEHVLADPAAGRRMGDRARAAIERHFSLAGCVRELLRHIDGCNPVPRHAEDLRLSAVRAGLAPGAVGLRRLEERRDSRIAQLLLANGRVPHEVVLKVHKPREGESRPPAARARKEFDVLTALTRVSRDGSDVPRPLYLDEQTAALLMEPCRGEPLDAIIRTGRFGGDVSSARQVTEAVHRTGVWLRHFQESTSASHDPGAALDRLVEGAIRDLAVCRRQILPAATAKAVRLQLHALKTRLAPASLRVTGTHRDFWPGNVFVADGSVQVIDFEGAGEGLPYEDVAYFLVQLEQFFPGPVLRRRVQPLGAAFLAGYLPGRHGFDWTAYELCRIAAALKILRSTAARPVGLRTQWRRQMLRGIVLGGAA